MERERHFFFFTDISQTLRTISGMQERMNDRGTVKELSLKSEEFKSNGSNSSGCHKRAPPALDLIFSLDFSLFGLKVERKINKI